MITFLTNNTHMKIMEHKDHKNTPHMHRWRGE